MDKAQAQQFFAKCNEADGLPPAGADEQLIREASAAMFAAGVSDAMDKFTAWQAKQAAAAAASKPAKAEAAKADWIQIDESKLTPEQAKLYAAKRTADKAAQAARETFEKAVVASVKPRSGKVLRFGYRFGKLSVAWVEEEAGSKPSKGAVALSDL